MAAIDFPASPTVGQAFTAGNGVIYVWNGLLWVASGSSAPGGDVQAGGGTFSGIVGTDVPIVFSTVLLGNSGGWLNISNGRYTPPAGRHFIQCCHICQAPAASNGSWTLAIRKNGVRLPVTGGTASGSQQFAIPITVGHEIEANGTDYFEFVANLGIAGMANNGGQFTAFPISGLKGPPGDYPSGALALYSEVVSIAGATFMEVAVPTPWPKRLELEWSFFSAGGVNNNVLLQQKTGGVAVGGVNYIWQFLYGTGTGVAAASAVSTSFMNLGTGHWTKGLLRLQQLPTPNPAIVIEGTSYLQNITNAHYALTHACTIAAAAGTPSHFRMGYDVGNALAVGSFLRCYVVT